MQRTDHLAPSSLQLQLQAALHQRDKALNQTHTTEKLYSQLKRTHDSNNNFSDKEKVYKEIKDLKMALADCQFQLRKEKEDIATERTMAELERVKLTKVSEQKIQELKSQLESDNQSWIKRYDIRDNEYHSQLTNSVRSMEALKNKEIQCLIDEYEKRILRMMKEREETVIELKEQISVVVGRMEREKNQVARKVEIKWESRMKEVEMKSMKEVEMSKKECEQRIKVMEAEKEKESALKELKRVELLRSKEILVEEVTALREQGKQLLQKTKQLESLTEQISQEKKRCVQELNLIRIQFEQQVIKSEENLLRREQLTKARSKTEAEQILYKHVFSIGQLESRLQELSQRHERQLEEHEQQLLIIKECYDERPSRPEDLRMIKLLEDRLWRKENQLQVVGQDLRWHRLQLQNKEETYTRIFTNGCLLREIKFPAEKSSLRTPLTLNKETKYRKGKSLLNKICYTKNSSFTENTPLAELCTKLL